jgi:hypothetical protein
MLYLPMLNSASSAFPIGTKRKLAEPIPANAASVVMLNLTIEIPSPRAMRLPKQRGETATENHRAIGQLRVSFAGGVH